MTTIIIWLLITTSDGAYNRGNIYVLERFATEKDCMEVKSQIPHDVQVGFGHSGDTNFYANCVKATVIK